MKLTRRQALLSIGAFCVAPSLACAERPEKRYAIKHEGESYGISPDGRTVGTHEITFSEDPHGLTIEELGELQIVRPGFRAVYYSFDADATGSTVRLVMFSEDTA